MDAFRATSMRDACNSMSVSVFLNVAYSRLLKVIIHLLARIHRLQGTGLRRCLSYSTDTSISSRRVLGTATQFMARRLSATLLHMLCLC